ncbi:MAG: MFS transporter [Patescibacteria group bacterium]|nr:MFS transporter [Patescibacteria group bacterium]
MFNRIHLNLPHYFSKHPSRKLVNLYWSVGMMGLGIATVAIFEPIFLYTLGYSLRYILFFYLMVYVGYFLILPVVGRIIARIGMEHSIFYSQFFLIAFYISLFGIQRLSFLFYVAPIIYAIQKSFYWPAYHADFVLFSDDSQRGREVGGLETLNMIVYIVGPFIGGAILEWSNYSSLFLIVAALFIFSAIPLLRIKEIHSQSSFSYRETLRKLYAPGHRRNFVAYLGFGEELIVMVMWPIFIFTVVKDFFEIGALVAIATLVTAFIALLLGKATDRYKKEHVLRFGSIVYAVSWLIRGFAQKAWQVLSFDTLSRLSKEALYVPLLAMTYENGKREDVLGYTVFYEQSLAAGKVIAAGLLLIVLSFNVSPWPVMFICSALFSLLYLFMKTARPRIL